MGKGSGGCYQFEIKIADYNIEYSVYVPKNDCPALSLQTEDAASRQRKVIKHKLSTDGLKPSYHIILRNSRSDGFAIIEQIIVSPST